MFKHASNKGMVPNISVSQWEQAILEAVSVASLLFSVFGVMIWDGKKQATTVICKIIVRLLIVHRFYIYMGCRVAGFNCILVSRLFGLLK